MGFLLQPGATMRPSSRRTSTLVWRRSPIWNDLDRPLADSKPAGSLAQVLLAFQAGDASPLGGWLLDQVSQSSDSIEIQLGRPSEPGLQQALEPSVQLVGPLAWAAIHQVRRSRRDPIEHPFPRRQLPPSLAPCLCVEFSVCAEGLFLSSQRLPILEGPLGSLIVPLDEPEALVKEVERGG
jgi:hypothetical protein